MARVQGWDWLAFVVLGIIAFSVFTFKSGDYPLIDRDEPLYSQVSRETMQSGDWWTLKHSGEEWFIHAPFSFWVQGAVFSVFGVSEFSARLPSAVFATGLVLLIAAFGTFLFDRKTGLVAGMMALSTMGIWAVARLAILDATLAFFTTLAIYAFVRGWKAGKWGWFALFWVACGLATLTKGLWGVVLPLMIVSLYGITDSKRKMLFSVKAIGPVIFWIVLVAPWFVIQTIRHGEKFLGPTLMTNTVQRMTEPVCGHAGPWYYYIPIILAALLPWVAFLPWSITRITGDNGRLMLFWIVPAFLLHSAASTKLPNYMLPIVPAFVLLLSTTYTKMKSRLWPGIVLVCIAVVLFLAFGQVSRSTAGDELTNSLMSIGLLVLSVASLMGGLAIALLKEKGAVITALVWVLALSVLPYVYSERHEYFSSKATALAAKEFSENSIMYIDDDINVDASLYYYSQMKKEGVQDAEKMAREYAKKGKSGTFIVKKISLIDSPGMEKYPNTEIIENKSPWAVVVVE